MPRTMTANLHISPQAKADLDAILPDKLDDSKVSYNEVINFFVYYFTKVLGFDKHDVINMLIDYRKVKLEAIKSGT